MVMICMRMEPQIGRFVDHYTDDPDGSHIQGYFHFYAFILMVKEPCEKIRIHLFPFDTQMFTNIASITVTNGQEYDMRNIFHPLPRCLASQHQQQQYDKSD